MKEVIGARWIKCIDLVQHFCDWGANSYFNCPLHSLSWQLIRTTLSPCALLLQLIAFCLGK